MRVMCREFLFCFVLHLALRAASLVVRATDKGVMYTYIDQTKASKTSSAAAATAATAAVVMRQTLQRVVETHLWRRRAALPGDSGRVECCCH